MKICIISMTNTFLCPYIWKYMSVLPKQAKKDLIYWDRHGVDERSDCFDGIYRYKSDMNEHAGIITKLREFLKYKNYCIRIIKANKYDRIIILHNYMAILMQRFLKKYYRSKYSIDIRDYSLENNRLFYYIERKAIENAGIAIISSDGYKSFLPSWDYVMCHNDPTISNEMIRDVINASSSEGPIRISFIGLVRFYDQNRKLLDLLGNDERFLVAFYGQNSEPLKEYAESAGIENAVFKGRFEPSETIDFYKDTDIINNYYGNHKPSLDYALSNKLYYAATFRKPILVCSDTYMEEIAMQYNFGIVLSDDIRSADELYDMFMNLDRLKMNEGCDAFIARVEKDNKIFEMRFAEFIYG